MDPSDDEMTLSRRTVLGGVAAIPAGFALPSASAAPTATVMTRNLYLGVDLFRLFDADSMADVREIAGELLDDVERHPYEARMDAIAAEIERAGADVVGLQEAALIRTQRPSDYNETSAENATEVVVDILDTLLSALAARGLKYDVAASTVTTDVEIPADTDDGVVDLRHTDRVAVLVRSGIETDETRTGIYDENVDLPIPDSDRELTLQRGYCLADVTLDGSEFTVAATHLESLSSEPRRQQAGELTDRLPTDRPVIALGDFNAGPATDSGTYGLLTETLEDAHAVQRPDEDGYTCCQPPALRNRQSQLDKRVDAVLYRGDIHSLAVDYVGDEPDDRVEARVDGEDVQVWPSDHAGVVATVELAAPTPTRTATASPTAMPPSTPTPDSDTPTRTSRRTRTSTAGRTETQMSSGSGPGFGVVATLVGLAIAALSRARRD